MRRPPWPDAAWWQFGWGWGITALFEIEEEMFGDLKAGDWIAIAAAVTTAVPFIWGAFQYIGIKRQEENARRFTTYHGIIQDLVERATKIDRQMAAVYELRNYPSYFPASYRILGHLQRTWGSSNDPKFRELIEEMRLAREFIARSG